MKRKPRFFMSGPYSTTSGKLVVKFCSNDPYPWYAGWAFVTTAEEALEKFEAFARSALEHDKIDHTKCDCCFHPRFR